MFWIWAMGCASLVYKTTVHGHSQKIFGGFMISGRFLHWILSYISTVSGFVTVHNFFGGFEPTNPCYCALKKVTLYHFLYVYMIMGLFKGVLWVQPSPQNKCIAVIKVWKCKNMQLNTMEPRKLKGPNNFHGKITVYDCAYDRPAQPTILWSYLGFCHFYSLF